MHTPVFPPTRNIVLWWSDVKKEIVLGVLCPLLFPPTWVFSGSVRVKTFQSAAVSS